MFIVLPLTISQPSVSNSHTDTALCLTLSPIDNDQAWACWKALLLPSLSEGLVCLGQRLSKLVENESVSGIDFE